MIRRTSKEKSFLHSLVAKRNLLCCPPFQSGRLAVKYFFSETSPVMAATSSWWWEKHRNINHGQQQNNKVGYVMRNTRKRHARQRLCFKWIASECWRGCKQRAVKFEKPSYLVCSLTNCGMNCRLRFACQSSPVLIVACTCMFKSHLMNRGNVLQISM